VATQLGNLHQVVSYVEIVRNHEPAERWENADGNDYFVRQLLGPEAPGAP
jgi:hypothetical protein